MTRTRTITPTIYRSTAPEVLRAWEEMQARWRACHDAVGEFEGRYPAHKALVAQTNDSYRFCGLKGDTAPGPEWRVNKNQGMWVPDKRSKAGKALAAEIEALSVTGLGRIPGMTDLVIDHKTSIFYHPGGLVIDGVMWVRWGCSYELVEEGAWGGAFDPDLWERAKASDYYRAVESDVEVSA